jgi:putative FmdB family regulatory protein
MKPGVISGIIIAIVSKGKGGTEMPIYEYQCVECGSRDQRVAGLDDHTALCTQCGSLMLRLDEDVFRPYFEEAAFQTWSEAKSKASSS